MDTLVAVATFGVLLLCWYLLKMAVKRAKMVHLVDKLPGPRAYPVIGNSWKVLTLPRNQLMAQAKKNVAEFGPLFRTWIGPLPEVHLIKPQHFELFLGSPKHIDKGLSYKFLHQWLGTGLLTSTGTKWHSHRKMITPTFHFKILENFQEVFVEKSEIMLKKLRPNAHGRVFDIYPFITRCALDIICETAMGTQLNAQEDTDSEYVNAVYDISEATINRALSPWLHPDFIFQRTKMGRRYQECIQQLHRFTNKVIQEKKSLLAGATRVTDQSSDEDTSIGKKKRRAFLDLLLEASLQEGGLSDEEIREEVDTFMFEGHDTTAAGISWTIFLLGIHPEIQVRVQRELDEIFQGVSRAATMGDVQEMKYLEQVIKESLRLYPSVPFIQRHLNQDIKLDEYLIPAGTTLTFEIFFAHRNPKYFPNPDQFNPDNFRLENVQARHPYAYIPFSAGPRNCIGQKFALQEEKTILSYLFRHYSVRCLDKMEDVVTLAELVLRPENGIRVVLTPRDKASLHTL